MFNSIKSTTSSVWAAIQSSITTPIENAKNTIRSALNSISGSFSLSPPSVPHLSVSWYKEGGIMDGPTFFDINGSNLMAGGEAGPEAILPLNGFYERLESILNDKLGNSNMEKYLAIMQTISE